MEGVGRKIAKIAGIAKNRVIENQANCLNKAHRPGGGE